MNYILVAYKIVNGFTRDFRLLEYSSNNKAYLEYLYKSDRYKTLKEQNYKFKIYEQNEELQ